MYLDVPDIHAVIVCLFSQIDFVSYPVQDGMDVAKAEDKRTQYKKQ